MKLNKLPNTLFLKIIGIITMTMDHFARIGSFLDCDWISLEVIKIFTIIGRISFPIFAFLVIEGMTHSKHPGKYLLRLGILSIFVDGIFYLVSKEYWGNPITTLFLGAVTIYFLKNDNKYLKLLSLIPIAITLLIAFEIIPLLAMYDLYGLSIILIFYYAKPISKYICKIISKIMQIDENTFIESYKFIAYKLTSILTFIVFNILIWKINPTYNNNNVFIDDVINQLYSLLSIPFILIYNGQKGYNKKWIQYTFYLYFPLHLCILYLLLIII